MSGRVFKESVKVCTAKSHRPPISSSAHVDKAEAESLPQKDAVFLPPMECFSVSKLPHGVRSVVKE
jgi:hypothetical protein